MSNHVYKQIELVGSSTKSTDDAIKQAIERASETLRHLDWFEVTEVRGHIKDGKVAHWQVGLKIGMRRKATNSGAAPDGLEPRRAAGLGPGLGPPQEAAWAAIRPLPGRGQVIL